MTRILATSMLWESPALPPLQLAVTTMLVGLLLAGAMLRAAGTASCLRWARRLTRAALPVGLVFVALVAIGIVGFVR